MILAVGAFTALGACGGSNGGGSNGGVDSVRSTNTPTVKQLENRVKRAIAEGAELTRSSPTAFNAMPTSGRATFKGEGFVYIDPVEARDDDDLLLVGDASLTARFGAGTLRGSITNMVGGKGETRATAETFNVGGRIDIGENTSIIGDDFDDNRTSDPNDWYADAEGRVTTPDGTFDVKAILEGKFIGTRVNNPNTDITTKGIIGGSDGGFATRNGREMAAEIEVFGTHTP